MKADDNTLQGILDSSHQYLIPVFQRYYSWEKGNWEDLWEDLTDLLEDQTMEQRHFMGSLVFVPRPSSPGSVPVFQVIDGQQRLMTLSLLLCAIRDAAKRISESENARRLAGEVEKNFLVREYKADREHFRVFPRQRDRAEYIAAVEGERAPGGTIGSTYAYFAERIREDLLGNEGEEGEKRSGEERAKALRKLFDVLKANLVFVNVILKQDENPYQIFRSLNSTGVDLSEGDLIRNFVFMHVSIKEQNRFDEQMWQPLEEHFHTEDGEINDSLFSSFFRHYLLKEGTYVPKQSTFYAFEERFGHEDFDPEHLTRELKRYAEYYDILRSEKPHDSRLITDSLRRLNQLSVSTAYPIFLNLMDRCEKGEVSEQALNTVIERVAGFAMRRLVCEKSSRTYVRWFPAACRKLENDPVENLTEFLRSKGYPSDDHFEKRFVKYSLYEGNHTREVLVDLEEMHEHREPADLSSTEVEHIMPQNLSDKWEDDLGEDAKRIHEEWLHTLGNLTLSGYNRELSNSAFAVKRPEYERSNIVMNRALASHDQWTEDEIAQRGQRLAERAATIWKGPPFEGKRGSENGQV